MSKHLLSLSRANHVEDFIRTNCGDLEFEFFLTHLRYLLLEQFILAEREKRVPPVIGWLEYRTYCSMVFFFV